jgi:hypothetical protein
MRNIGSKMIDDLWRNLAEKLRFEVGDSLISEVVNTMTIYTNLYSIRGDLMVNLYSIGK